MVANQPKDMLREIAKGKRVHPSVILDGDVSVDMRFQKKLRARQGVTDSYKGKTRG